MGLELSKTDSETDGILELWFEVKGSGCGWRVDGIGSNGTAIYV